MPASSTEIPHPMKTDTLSTTLHAVADPTRRAILARLRTGNASVKELAEPFELSLPAVTKHIRVLELSGVIARHRRGRDHILTINTHSLDEIDGWIDGTRRFWETRLDAMESLLRELKTAGPKGDAHGER